MPLYRPPDADGQIGRGPIRGFLRNNSGTVRGGLRPALEDTSRDGNRTIEIAHEQQLAAGIRPSTPEPTPPTRDPGEFNRGYENIGAT